MTLIAIDDNMIAADGMAMSGDDIITSMNTRKLVRRDGAVYAFSGAVAMRTAMIDWCHAGADPKNMPKTFRDDDNRFNLFRADHRGTIMYTDLSPYPEPIRGPYAVGYGREAALMAMSLGKTAREAVALTRKHNLYVGGKVRSMPLPKVSKNLSSKEGALVPTGPDRDMEPPEEETVSDVEFAILVDKMARGVCLGNNKTRRMRRAMVNWLLNNPLL